jgi:hypothetical protein
VESLRTFTSTGVEEMNLVNRLARKNAIVELDKKTTGMNYRECCHVYCFSVLNVDDEDLMRSSLAREGGVERSRNER